MQIIAHRLRPALAFILAFAIMLSSLPVTEVYAAESAEDTIENLIDAEEVTEEQSSEQTEPVQEEIAPVEPDETETAPGDSEQGVTDETETAPGETDQEVTDGTETDPEETALAEPDYSGYALIPGMKEHMIAKPGSEYKAVDNGFYTYLDMELFEGTEIDHINVYANRITAEDANQYMTVYVVDSATAEVRHEYKFYAKAEALKNFTTGRIVSLYPESGTTVKVEEGQTLGFGKSDDSLVFDFQNKGTVPADLTGFYMQSTVKNGTSGGSLCIDVYAKAAPQKSEKEEALRTALAGKKLSILGDGISTYGGWSNSTTNNSTLEDAPLVVKDGVVPYSVLQTWWKQAADRYDMEILVNNSWGGSRVTSETIKEKLSDGWYTRPKHLHDNTFSDNPNKGPVNPDLIAVYMGTNDIINGVTCNSTNLDNAFFNKIEATNFKPQAGSFEEACAVMVYKIRQNYPNANIFLFNSPTMKSGTEKNPAAYNQVFTAIAQRYECHLIDLQSSALSTYVSYTHDGVHPNSAGMDVITESFAEKLYDCFVEHTTHTEVESPQIDPTCDKTGLTKGTYCSVCREVFSGREEIPAAGHQYELVYTGVWDDPDTTYEMYSCNVCYASYLKRTNDTMPWDSIYLSTVDEITKDKETALIAPQSSKVGHDSLKKDMAPDGSTISLKVDGTETEFTKGLGAHATSSLIYNISLYTGKYTEFSTYVGVDSSRGGNGSVWFEVLGSVDGETWISLHKTGVLTGNSKAVHIRVDVKDYNYLKLHADSNGSNGSDHSVYGSPRLIIEGLNVESEAYPRLHTLEWYNQTLSQYDYSYNIENNMKLILEREFVNRIGLGAIQNGVKTRETMADTLNWLLDDTDALQLFIETGNIIFGANTLNNLDTLYTKYKDILGDEGDAYVYKKMLIALAVTWANDTVRTPYKFGGSVLYIDIVERFETAKWIYDQGVLLYGKDIYKSYNMELMRAMMNDYVGIDEAKWLQAYAAKKFPDTPGAWTAPYRFMSYVTPVYSHDKYFTEDTWKEYDAKYDLTQYNIPRTGVDNKVFRLWMVYESGGVCWNISRVGQTLNRSFGIPTVGTFQPAHEAYYIYSQNEKGEGIWNIGNNVFGWQNSYNNWSGLTYRMPLNWGSGTAYSKNTKNNTTYILLAQGAMNRYEDLQKSMYLNMLADAYSSTEDKLEIYRASLNALDLNLDTYLDIISQYKEMGEKATPEIWRDLAREILQTEALHLS